jgi:hypothetical protein
MSVMSHFLQISMQPCVIFIKCVVEGLLKYGEGRQKVISKKAKRNIRESFHLHIRITTLMILCLHYWQNYRLLVWGEETQVQVWSLQAHLDTLLNAAFSPTKNQLSSCSSLWEWNLRLKFKSRWHAMHGTREWKRLLHLDTFSFWLLVRLGAACFQRRYLPTCTLTVVQVHRAARASSSGEQKICLAPPASELHVTFKSGKRRAAQWICTTVETQLKR